ncbi:beta strand repeat-containing protein [Haloferula sp. A504]|uniref:beta strand repeat-containing protein n=1 Tax=Haloferula sp. A504 TaxID=3373601 RepID=UPI0031C60047|nr:autotransporter-associated beta strand repeat-containing protein [Verrucomicrobiaceae bacterium E54]
MRLPALLIFASILPGPLLAATFTWDGNGPNDLLLEPINWLGNNAPPDDGTADIVLAGSVNTSPRLNGNFDLNSITFASGAFPFSITEASGAGIQFDLGPGGITNLDGSTQEIDTDIFLTATQLWHADAGALRIGTPGTVRWVNLGGNTLSAVTDTLESILFYSELRGTGNLTKSGLGTLTLYNDGNSWSGATTVNGGILRVSADNAFSPGSSLNIGTSGRFDLNGFNTTALWLGGGGQLDLGGGELTAGDISNRTYNGVIEGTGGRLIKQGSGSLTLTGAQITEGTDYWAQEGSLIVQNTLGSNASVTVNPGAVIDVQTPTLNLVAAGPTELIGSGDIELNQNDLNYSVPNGETAFFFGRLLGGANADLTKLGDGKLVLDDADSYTGEIRVNDGTLGFNSNNLFDATDPLGSLIIQSTGRVELGGTQQTFYDISGSGPIDLDGGELRLLGDPVPGNYGKSYSLDVTGQGDLLFADTTSINDASFPDIQMFSSGSYDFTGSFVVESGIVGGLEYHSSAPNTLDIRQPGTVSIQHANLTANTLIGAGTFSTLGPLDLALLGDGQSHTFSGVLNPRGLANGGECTVEIRNQSWTFNGHIDRLQDEPPVRAVVGGDASTSFRTNSLGDMAIPNEVLVESGGTAGFVLNSTSATWQLEGPSGVNPTSGTVAINASNNALATVTLLPSFNNILLVSTSTGARVRLLQSGGASAALLSGSGEVELGGDLTLDSLSGTMDIDLRGHDLTIDIASSEIFEGRFVDSVGGGRIYVRGAGDLELRGMSTFDGLLDIGVFAGTAGKVTANTNEALSDNASLDISNGEFDLLDHALTILNLRSSGPGVFRGSTGSSLTVDEIYFNGAFAGDLDLVVDPSSSSFSFDQRLWDASGQLGSLTSTTTNLSVARADIDVMRSIDLEWSPLGGGGDRPFEIVDSTLRSTGADFSFRAQETDGWTGSSQLEISGSTLEGGLIGITSDAPVSIVDSVLRPVDNGHLGTPRLSIGDRTSIDISGSTLGNSALADVDISMRAFDLAITGSSLDAGGSLTLLNNDGSTGNAVISGSTVTAGAFKGGDRPSHTFDWRFSSLSALESEVAGIWTIEASDLDFGTLTANPGATADFRSGSISLSNDLRLGFGEFLGTGLTLTGLHALNVGGTLTLGRFASLTLDGGDLGVGDMTIDGEFDWIDGDLTVGGAFNLGSSSFLGTDLMLGNRQDLIVNGGFTTNYGSSLVMDGGSIRTTGLGNSFGNFGTFSLLRGPVRTEAFTNGAGATAFIGSLLTVENQAFQSTSAWNSGTLEMTGPGAILQLQGGGRLSNDGLISGTGVIDGGLVNDNVFSPGRIRADLGESLRITGDLDNSGTVELVGGSVEVQGTMTNTGEVSGRGLLAGNRAATTAIDNQGTMTFSGGTSDVYGNVSNSTGGTIISTGGGVVTFHDDFAHNGDEMRTSAGSSAVFLGDVTGTGTFNGTGTVYFEGTFNPGTSPGLVTATVDLIMGPSLVSTFEIGGYGQGTEYDFLDSDGDLTLDGMFHVLLYGGFTPTAGDSFDLFDAPSITGSFDEVTASELPEGLEWDFSQLESDGIVAVQSTVTDPYDAWTAFWGLHGADALRSADPNGDGVSNLEHFAFDTNPNTGGTDGRCRVEIALDGADRHLTYTIPVRVGAIFDASPSATIDGIAYALTGDDDLVGVDLTVVERSPLAAGLPALRDIDGDTFPDWEYRSFRLADPVSVRSRGFMQVSVTEAP